jgi:hypothetical protein
MRGQVFRIVGESNSCRVRAAIQPEAFLQSAPRGVFSEFRDPLRVLHAGYRSDTPVRLATCGMLRFLFFFSTQLMVFRQRRLKRR